jgi:hypothetical protein
MAIQETKLVNAFETTLDSACASGASTIDLADDPGVTAKAYFVIDPDNDSKREVVLWNSGAYGTAAVTRDVDAKHGTDPAHAAGTTVRLAVVKQHIEDLHDRVDAVALTGPVTGTLAAGTSAVATTLTTSQNITALTGGDLTVYEDANNADVSLKLGTSATEALSIEVLNGGSNKTAEEVKIKTSTASGTANHGKISIYIDDTEIMDIDDGGIDMASGKTVAINGTDLITSGGKVLQVVTAVDSGDTTATASATYVDTNLGATITPANSSNKILVLANQTQSFTPDGTERISMSAIERAISGGATTVVQEKFMGSHATTTVRHPTAAFMYVDSPSTTSATTYKIQSKVAAGNFRHNENGGGGTTTGTITLVEIEG